MTKREIAETVAAKHGLTLKELFEPTHRWRISHARQEAFALCYARRDLSRGQFDPYSLPAIGRYFRRDHTTVLWGVRAYARRQAAAQ